MLLLHKVDAILIITNIYHSVLMDVHGKIFSKNPSFLNYKSNIYVKLQRPQSSHIHFISTAIMSVNAINEEPPFEKKW